MRRVIYENLEIVSDSPVATDALVREEPDEEEDEEEEDNEDDDEEDDGDGYSE